MAGIVVSTMFFARAGIVDAARLVAQKVAGIGELEWEGPDGWHPVAAADARRRRWTAADAFLVPTWEPAANGLELATLDVRRPPNPQVIGLFLARVDPAAWRFRVWARPDWQPDSVAKLADTAGLALAVNASYFSDEDGPIGLVVSDGVRRRRQASKRAAHFLVDANGVRIVNQRPSPDAPTPGVDGALREGFQGFPAIMSARETYAYMRYGGRGFDVWKVARRTAACTDGEGRVVLLVTDTLTNGLALTELATVLGGLGCVDAMAFDGGSSTGMALRLDGRRRDIPNVEPVPVVVGISPLPPTPSGEASPSGG